MRTVAWGPLATACATLLLGIGIPSGSMGAQQLPRITVPAVVPLVSDAAKPTWAVEGVPDTVWLLVKASSEVLDDEDRMKALLEDAEAQARAAVEEEDNVARRFALAVVLGMRANGEGGRTRVLKASDLHKELDVILERAPDHAGARHLIGRLHAGIRRMNRITRWIATNLLGGAELKKATWELAEQNLLFAEQYAPDVSDHHLQLANLYRDTDRSELALREVGHVMEMRLTSLMEEAVLDEALALREKLGR